jgi:ribosome-associated toxin RatA of RatAB toxin-antitoxin module
MMIMTLPTRRMARRASAFLFGALLPLASMLAAGSAVAAGITISVERRGDAIAIEASALLGVDTATAWRVLTDYGRYPEFIPGLTASRVVARKGPTVIVEQDGYAQVWLLRAPLAVTYEITEVPPGRVRSRAVSGSLRLLESDYRLTPLANGVQLDYTGLAATGTGLFGPFEQWVIEQNATLRFRALTEAMERAAR